MTPNTLYENNDHAVRASEGQSEVQHEDTEDSRETTTEQMDLSGTYTYINPHIWTSGDSSTVKNMELSGKYVNGPFHNLRESVPLEEGVDREQVLNRRRLKLGQAESSERTDSDYIEIRDDASHYCLSKTVTSEEHPYSSLRTDGPAN